MIDIFPTLTLISHILILIALAFYSKTKDILHKKALVISFILVTTATMGSLFYSEILGYVPCELCWYQRILMYPMSLLFLFALTYRDDRIYKYTLPISIIGALLSGFHYISQFIAFTNTCSIGQDCALKFVFHYGYITIPLMAFTIFVLVGIISFMMINRKIRLGR